MNEPITFTLSSLLLLAGAIHHFREPEETQDERIGTLERIRLKRSMTALADLRTLLTEPWYRKEGCVWNSLS